MNNNLNVWTNFALNHIYKDLNEDALKTIDALMFLSPPDKNSLKESFSFNLDIGLDFVYTNRSPVKVQKETTYNFADFLVLKLIENFRRIYAIEKKEENNKKSPAYKKRGLDLDYSELLDHEINPTKIGPLNDNKKTNLKNLEEQQSNIYSTISKLKDFLFFKDDLTVYPKAVVGKNYETTIFEISCYLGVHQSLKKENINSHRAFVESMDNSFSLSSIDLKNVKLFNKLYYPYEKRDFIQMYLKKIPPLSLVDDYLSFSVDRPGNFYKIILIDLLGQAKDLSLSKEQKAELLVDLFRNSFFKYFSFEEKINFEEKMDNLFTDIDYGLLFKKHIISPSKAGSAEYEFVIQRINSSNDEQLFLKSFYENLTLEDKDTLLKLFDLNDQSLLKRVVDILSEKSNGSEKLQNILPHFHSISKDTLAYIVAKNSDFFPIVQPYYLVEKLTPALKDKPMSNFSNTPKKI